MRDSAKTPEKPTDAYLWSNLRIGDEMAFSTLFEKYFDSLVSYGISLMPFPEKVQDCVQDVFVNIWLYKHSLSETVVVKAYLLSSVRKRIARLHEREHIFSHTTSLDSVDFSIEFSIEEKLIADEEMSVNVIRLNQLINSLPSRQKEALYLRYYQGLTVEQIADVLSINHQSAKNLLHRTLLQLRKEWTISIFMLFWILSKAN